MKIERPKHPRLIFEGEEEGWVMVREEEHPIIAKALANQLRYLILKELDTSPLRQFELAQRLSKICGKRYPQTLIRHHLRYLQRAGLVDFRRESGSPGRAKVVYKKTDVYIYLRVREEPPSLSRRIPPRTKEEVVGELRKILSGERS